MLTAVFAALMLQQAAGMISWNPPPAPDPEAPVEAAAPVPAGPVTTIPEWGLADPFGWERSQCSPMIRKDASMELCQARVRTDLATALGDKLPAGLQPSGVEGCRQVSNGAGGYELTCAPPRREMAASTAPVAEVCEERPSATGSGGVNFERRCTPATGPKPDEGGLKFRLGGD
ncbi:hypothetical protein [Brevundimonas goettingensis]|uniref:Uncharacterized protein n=1 Tax=Brevundimonas goettingensis TaxID=2774190 RepID=A0A975C1Q8_9CAUL|nr:hypothetical protein [Brevundimonas goettingensis]QTC91895.1 hypothetical protein IFJ75_02910 [Brevundimonas goettingensis]